MTKDDKIYNPIKVELTCRSSSESWSGAMIFKRIPFLYLNVDFFIDYLEILNNES